VPWQSLEFLSPTLEELQPSAWEKILDHARHQNFAWLGLRHYTCSDMDRNATDIAFSQFYLAERAKQLALLVQNRARPAIPAGADAWVAFLHRYRC
jgi:hypothetical protein